MDIEQIDDLATAKRVMRAQQSRVKTLTEQLLKLAAEIALLKGDALPEQIAIELANVQEQLANANQRLFGIRARSVQVTRSPSTKRPSAGMAPTNNATLRE